MRYSEETKNKVCRDIEEGASILDVVKKYGISQYYARKWTGEIYKKIDLDTMVRTRYRELCCTTRVEIASEISHIMKPEEAQAITEETWDSIDYILKEYLYEFAKGIIRAN